MVAGDYREITGKIADVQNLNQLFAQSFSLIALCDRELKGDATDYIVHMVYRARDAVMIRIIMADSNEL